MADSEAGDQNQPIGNDDIEDEPTDVTQADQITDDDRTDSTNEDHQTHDDEYQAPENVDQFENHLGQGDYSDGNPVEMDQQADDNEQNPEETVDVDNLKGGYTHINNVDETVDGSEQDQDEFDDDTFLEESDKNINNLEDQNIDDDNQENQDEAVTDFDRKNDLPVEADMNINNLEDQNIDDDNQENQDEAVTDFDRKDDLPVEADMNINNLDDQNIDDTAQDQDVAEFDHEDDVLEEADKNIDNDDGGQHAPLGPDVGHDESNSNNEQKDSDLVDEAEDLQQTSSLQLVSINIIQPSNSQIDESIDPIYLDATATVKFVLMPSGQVVTLACTLGQTFESLKSHFASELKMQYSLIVIMVEGKPMPDGTTLADLGVGPNGMIQLEMQSADPVNSPLKSYRPRQEYHMPDVITVRVLTEDCEPKDVVVEIERSRTKKPFLGGFRNKNTGMEFHNASAQTMQKPRPPPTSERFCRDTQTCEQRNAHQQTHNCTSTQMTTIGVYISNIEDKVLGPGEYCTADEFWAMILSKVIILQKNFRRWLAKRYIKQLKEDKENRLEWERLEELRKKKEKEERLQREYARRINPKTKADFDRLLHCLEVWRKEEMERINLTLNGAEQKAAICMLLDQETELLSAIERHKNEANYENRSIRIMNFLEKAAAPKMWQAHDGKLTYMDTPFTIRAKELRDIYNSINMKYLTQDERLDVLLTLKHTVREHDCKLTQEIIELINREADLLMRGVKESNLTGLRKRICTLFLQYIKTPTFNPEAAKFLKVPQDETTLRKNINYCRSCGSYLPSTEFFITTNSRNAGRCRRCQKIENEGRQRDDHTYFKVMLKALHKYEEAMQDGSTLCYLLQENDLRYLVENIWSNQSVLSAWNDPYDLVLCRWNKHQEWSPWNCILLTHDEAEAHKKLFSLEEGYGHVFIHKVTQKHNFARNYFSRLPGMATALRKQIGTHEINKGASSVVGHSVPKIQKV